ncbi:MAG: aldehyde dehydrogenase family protein [Nevskiales bacterium]|nr:aldehyde dehydrogenase family protein [Nevskiales bacterium]
MSAVMQMPVGATAENAADELRMLFDRQAARALELRRSTAEERKARIRKLLDLMEKHREDIIAAAAKDCGKPAPEVELTEIYPVVGEAREALRHIDKWMKPRKVGTTLSTFGTKAQIRYEPRGVSLIISPWNYPVTLSFRPLVSAFAAGCPVILKPSEMTPTLSALMKRMIESAYEPEDVAVVEGAADISQRLLALPFDHIFFTGSPKIGRVVMAAAAKNLTSVTLELGGKSPVIVDRDADLDKAARNLSWGKFTNCGQTCIAPDHIYVHEDIADALMDKMQQRIKQTFGQDANTQLQSKDYARIVNHHHHGRVNALLKDAVDKGARIVTGGTSDASQNYLAPTLITDVPKDSQIMEEEIFGPVLPIIRFREIDTPIAEINARPKPLALYYFGRDKDRMEKVISSTSAGGTVVNHVVLHFLHPNLPFGGVNNSGLGNSHGKFGFEAFSHARSVLIDKFSSTHMLFPPYTAGVRRLIHAAIRWLT